MVFSSRFSSTSLLADKANRGQKITNFVTRRAKEFKVKTKNRMIAGPHTGYLLEKSQRRGGQKGQEAFKRFHKVSAPGERPSPDTLTLVNAISDRPTGDSSAEVYIAPKINPENGQSADVYGSHLQYKLKRKIMVDEDVAEERKGFRESGEALAKTFF